MMNLWQKKAIFISSNNYRINYYKRLSKKRKPFTIAFFKRVWYTKYAKQTE